VTRLDLLDKTSARATAVHRASQPGFGRWLDHVSSAGGCEHPIRLAGQLHTVNPTTGEILCSRSTHSLPDGVIYVSCGDRRASVCPACAETYRADTYHLIRAGLVGGKGVPDTVATHPVVFATFTAPAFGPVHTRVIDPKTGKVKPCRLRRNIQRCPHGRIMACPQRHDENSPASDNRSARSATTTPTTSYGTPGPPNCGGAPRSPLTATCASWPRPTTSRCACRSPKSPNTKPADSSTSTPSSASTPSTRPTPIPPCLHHPRSLSPI
jgi:hypothetical protein